MNCRLAALLAVLFLSCAVGCSQSTEVSGSVTYNGEIVEKGSISFAPAGGAGQGFGAKIVDGKYQAAKAFPGSKVVVIRGVRKIDFGKSTADSMKRTQEAQAAGKEYVAGNGESADYIPEDAEGNGQTVDVSTGTQTLDFAIKGPPRS